MSIGIELITAIAGSAAATEVGIKLWETLRNQLAEKNVTDIPEKITTHQQFEAASKVVMEKTAGISDIDDHSVTINTLTTARNSAVEYRKERGRQAKLAFNAALVLSIVGILIIFVGVILLFVKDSVTPGAITAGVGAISEIVSLLLFKLSKDANGRYDDVGKDLSRIDRAKEASDIARQIDDPAKRDQALREVVKSLGQPPDKDEA